MDILDALNLLPPKARDTIVGVSDLADTKGS